MFVQFDPNQMHLQVIVGTLEKYEPSKELEATQELVNELRDQLKKFQTEVMGPKLDEIQKRVEEENKRFQDQFKEETKEDSPEVVSKGSEE